MKKFSLLLAMVIVVVTVSLASASSGGIGSDTSLPHCSAWAAAGSGTHPEAWEQSSPSGEWQNEISPAGVIDLARGPHCNCRCGGNWRGGSGRCGAGPWGGPPRRG